MAKCRIQPITLYKVEVGVLLPETHKDYEGFSCVYDKKHAYYDENTIFFTNKRRACEYVRQYVKKGKLNTYGIVSALIYNPMKIYKTIKDSLINSYNDLKEIEDTGIFNEWESAFDKDELYSVDNVIYNIYKAVLRADSKSKIF